MTISVKNNLIGNLSAKTIEIEVSTKQVLTGSISTNAQVTGNVNMSSGVVIPPVYDGETIVTPSASEDKILHTADKMMVSDVTVEQIPYSEVSNTSNGITVTIA